MSACVFCLYRFRPLPLNEIRAVATFLENIFTCNTESWPTETLTHRYWARFGGDHASSVAFVQCLRQQNYTSATCHEHTVPICGKRFGEKPPSRLDECNRLLWSEKFRAKYPNDEVRRAFARRQKCLTELRSLVSANPSGLVHIIHRRYYRLSSSVKVVCHFVTEITF